MQKITPNLWFNHNAREAVEFYTSIFPDSRITGGSTYPDSEAEGLADFQRDLAGKDLTITFDVAGYEFVAINAGPEFAPTPALSFMVNFDPSRDAQARKHLDELWGKLIQSGEVLMELGEYPFSKRYGWVKDTYGHTWQLILTNPSGEERPFIVPNFMFSGVLANRAEEALKYYTSLFSNSTSGTIARYEQAIPPVKAGGIMFADFAIENQWFAIMDAPGEHAFGFNEAVSLSVACDDQAKIDKLWHELSTIPEAEQCGWCKDKFGVSWQIVPKNIDELMKKPGAFATMMQQKKIVISEY